jgi:uncharacterized membrane protein YkvA (DUF1232 family)
VSWFSRIRQKARALKIELHAMWFVARHPNTPWLAKIILIAVLLYAANPIDLIPDFIPFFGMLDDILIIVAGLWLARRLTPQWVMTECREKARTIDREGGLIRSLFRD